jgi:5-methylcytosine-specific restriction endonuclease McrA
MSRSTEEWRGKTDDTPVPPRVRARVFAAKGGRCHRCTRLIDAAGGEAWTCEHLVALINGGQNHESNLDVTCSWCLPIKNAEDVAEKSRVYRKAAKNIGVDLRPSQRRIQSPGFRKAGPQRSASRPIERKNLEKFS